MPYLLFSSYLEQPDQSSCLLLPYLLTAFGKRYGIFVRKNLPISHITSIYSLKLIRKLYFIHHSSYLTPVSTIFAILYITMEDQTSAVSFRGVLYTEQQIMQIINQLPDVSSRYNAQLEVSEFLQQDFITRGERIGRWWRYVEATRNWTVIGEEAFRQDWEPIRRIAQEQTPDPARLVTARKTILDAWGKEARYLTIGSYYAVSKVVSLTKHFTLEQAQARIYQAFVARALEAEDHNQTWELNPTAVDYAKALRLVGIPEVTSQNLRDLGLYFENKVLKYRPQRFVEEGSIPLSTPVPPTRLALPPPPPL